MKLEQSPFLGIALVSQYSSQSLLFNDTDETRLIHHHLIRQFA